MMNCFGRKAECKAPCEGAARCIEESGRVFSAQLAPHPAMGKLAQDITAVS